MSKISCSTSTFCMAVTWNGDSYRFAHGQWLKAQQVVASGSDRLLMSVSCPTTSFCVAIGENGKAYSYTNGMWSEGAVISESGLASISCPSSSFCVASNEVGEMMTYVDGSWSTPVSVDTGTAANPLTSPIVSCSSSSFCAAVDGNGLGFTYANGSWTAPQLIDVNTGSEVDASNITMAVSCSSPTFCMAVDQGGYALAYNGSGWIQEALLYPPSVQVTGVLLGDVSCPAANECLATGPKGYVFTYSGGSWGIGQSLGDRANLRSISCPIVSFCMVDTPDGGSYRFTGSVAATPPTTLPATPAVESCTNQPGDVVERPPMIGFGCAGANTSVANITWSSWSNSQATGTGTYSADNCIPDCAQGGSTSEQVQVVLSQPGTYLGSEVFQVIVVTPVGGGQPVQSETGGEGGGWGALQ